MPGYTDSSRRERRHASSRACRRQLLLFFGGGGASEEAITLRGFWVGGGSPKMPRAEQRWRCSHRSLD